MFVEKLHGPDDNRPTAVEAPDWGAIEGAIRLLDGDTRTLVTFSRGEEAPHMAVGGGAGGRYVAYITFDNRRFYNLTDPHQPDKKILLVTGGQEGEFEAKQCVDLATVLKVARAFAERGEVDPSACWSIAD
jgi:Immunity protein Imm1